MTAYVYNDTLTVLPIHHSAGLHSLQASELSPLAVYPRSLKATSPSVSLAATRARIRTFN